jgi:hypothetical protein
MQNHAGQKKKHKNRSSNMHKTEVLNGYLASHLVILLLIFDDLQAPSSLKQLTSVIL